MRAVRFEEYGDVDVLKVEEVPTPEPGHGEVVVRVVTAGTNPGEASIRSGAGKDRFPAHFPEGEGSDLAGVISAVGDGVQGVAVGQAVVGLSDGRNAQAEYALLPADRVVPKPDGLDWAAAATLYVAGTTALVMLDVDEAAARRDGRDQRRGGRGRGLRDAARGRPPAPACSRSPGRTTTSGCARGARSRSRTATASRSGCAELAPEGVAAFLDTYGDGYIELALRLGVPKERIETITDFPTAGRLGTVAKGMAAMADPAAGVARLAGLVADGAIEVPIKGRFPLEAVQDAYRAVESRSGLGKVVLDVSAPDPSDPIRSHQAVATFCCHGALITAESGNSRLQSVGQAGSCHSWRLWAREVATSGNPVELKPGVATRGDLPAGEVATSGNPAGRGTEGGRHTDAALP